MLLEFEVSNFRSIKDLQTLSLLPSSAGARKSATGNSYFPHALKVAAIYGPNGSGKSNFATAFDYVSKLLDSNSRLSSDEKIVYYPFMFDEPCRSKPSTFSVLFKVHDSVWKYSFEVNETGFCGESLTARKNAPRSKEVVYFSRENNRLEYLHSKLSKYRDLLVSQTNDNQLYLSKLDQNRDGITKPAFFWVTDYFRVIKDLTNFPKSISAQMISHGNKHEAITGFLKGASIRVSEIDVEQEERDLPSDGAGDKLLEIFSNVRSSVHSMEDNTLTSYDIKFGGLTRQNTIQFLDFSEESSGTKNLFALAGALLETFKYGFTLIIDELNQTFHTEVLKMIIDLFLSEEANPNGAQLIFTSHDIDIMNFLEKDEVWFIEKNNFGESEMFALSDFGSVRESGNRKKGAFGKRYLEGRYGALPDINIIEVINRISANNIAVDEDA